MSRLESVQAAHYSGSASTGGGRDAKRRRLEGAGAPPSGLDPGPTLSTRQAPQARGLTGPSAICGATPARRVNEGKWTDEEHARFLQGLQNHGHNWKIVSKVYVSGP
jgi:hypothetical protein